MFPRKGSVPVPETRAKAGGVKSTTGGRYVATRSARYLRGTRKVQGVTGTYLHEDLTGKGGRAHTW